ncbi:MAG TPA: DUF4432 family protein [Chloroflexota bacterium]|nr:DUF4432 family protein [Chloroflexota bacterium]
MTATIEEERLASGWLALTLRNEAMEVVLLPHKGSEIYALRARRHELDLLWKAPWGLRPPPVHAGTGAASQAAWLDHYAGGWQELFPNAGDACQHAGAPHPFHGEASLVPWDYELVVGPGGVPAVQLGVRLARAPFRLEKRVRLDPERPVLFLEERVTNEGRTPLPFMWGHHPAYGAPFLQEGCLLEVPAAAYEANEPQTSPHSWVIPGERSPWPHVSRAGGGTVDLSRVPGPGAAVANLGYLLDMAEGWYALTNPRLGLGIGLAWPREVFSCLWLWQELGGTPDYPWYGAAYVMGVEPHTSHPGQGLVRAIERGTARTLEPGESLAANVTAVLFEPRGSVRRVTLDGDVEFGP